jgi:hypothetical protein
VNHQKLQRGFVIHPHKVNKDRELALKMPRRRKNCKPKVPLLGEKIREDRGDYEPHLPNAPGTRRCSRCREWRHVLSFADACPSRFEHQVDCMGASCCFQACAKCCDAQCRFCRKFMQVRCPCCDGRRRKLKDTLSSHYASCYRRGQCHGTTT